MSTEYLSPEIIYFDPFSYQNLWYNKDESFNNLDILWCSIFLILVLIRLILYAFLQWNNCFFNISFSSITGFSLTVLSDIVFYEFTCNFNSFMDFFFDHKINADRKCLTLLAQAEKYVGRSETCDIFLTFECPVIR